MQHVLWISLGGAFGTGARYLISSWTQRSLGPAFPYGTFAVNFIGCFVLGIFMSTGLFWDKISPTVRLALTTGAMGGFTTYATFSYETLALLQKGSLGLAALYVGLTIAACLVASFCGVAAGRLIVGT